MTIALLIWSRSRGTVQQRRKASSAFRAPARDGSAGKELDVCWHHLGHGFHADGADSDHHILTYLPAGAPWLLAVYSWGLYCLLHAMGIFSQPILGYLSDRLGRKTVLFLSFITLGILIALLRSVAPGIPLAFVVAAIGLFFYTLLNVTFAAAMDIADSKLQATSYGLSSLTMQLATSPTPIVAGWLIDKYGIGSAFVLAGVLTLLGGLLLLSLTLYRETRVDPLTR